MNKPSLVVFGGSFDPVHYGHLELANHVKARFGINRVVLVPANLSPHKVGQPATNPEHRLRMLHLSTKNQPGLEVSDIELTRKGISYTIDTIDQLQIQNPETELHLLMGLDAFQGIRTWKDAFRLLESCNLLISSRPGYEFSDPAKVMESHLPVEAIMQYSSPVADNGYWQCQHKSTGKKLVFFDMPPIPISSSNIRNRIRQNCSIKNLLPLDVENYIIGNRLYRTTSLPESG